MELIRIHNNWQLKKLTKDINDYFLIYTSKNGNINNYNFNFKDISITYCAKKKNDNNIVLSFRQTHCKYSVEHDYNIITTESFAKPEIFTKFYFYCSLYLTEFYDCFLVKTDIIDSIYEIMSSNKKLLEGITRNVINFKDKYVFVQNTLNVDFVYAYIQLYSKPNILSWVLNKLVYGLISHFDIIELCEWVNNYPKQINKLSKNTITAYNNADDIKLLFKEMRDIKYAVNSLAILNKFNTTQKKLLKEHHFSFEEIVWLRKFTLLSKIKQNNFIRKISNITNVNEILELIRIVSQDKFDWNKESLNTYINENLDTLNCKIVYDNDNILILQVFDYYTISKLAKSTNWCIAKQKNYWNDYINHHNGSRKQFIVFNFNVKEDDNLSIIGITTNLIGAIIYSHSFINENLIESQECRIKRYKNIFNLLPYEIYSILNYYNIPLSVFTNKNNLDLAWNKESVKHMISIKSPLYTEIIFENYDKLIIRTTDKLFNLFGSKFSYIQEILDYDNSYPIIIFFDFSKKSYDEKALYFGRIATDDNIEYVDKLITQQNELYDRSFNDLCNEFGTDENIIVKINNIYSLLKSAFYEDDYNVMKEIIDKNKEDSFFLGKDLNALFYRTLRDSICSDYSEFILNLLYDNDIKLSCILSMRDLNNLVARLIHKILSHSKIFVEKKIEPIQEIFIKDDIVKARMSFSLFTKIMKKENNIEILETALNELDDYNSSDLSNFFHYLFTNYSDEINRNKKIKLLIFEQIFEHNLNDVIEYIIDNYQFMIDNTMKKIASINLNIANPFFKIILNEKQNNFFNKLFK